MHRIVTIRPDVLLVEKSVSRIAREYLYQAGITLIINVKQVSYRRGDRVCRKFYGDGFIQPKHAFDWLIIIIIVTLVIDIIIIIAIIA